MIRLSLADIRGRQNAHPSLDPIVFLLMQFSGTFGQNNRLPPFGVCATCLTNPGSATAGSWCVYIAHQRQIQMLSVATARCQYYGGRYTQDEPTPPPG